MFAIWVMAAAAFLLLAVALAWGFRIRREIRTWTACLGRYDSRVREQRDLLSRYRILYTDPKGQTCYLSAWTFFAGDFRLGDEIPVILDPHTHEARVNRFGFLYAHPLELATVGFYLLVMVVWVLNTHP